jgi:hypothetical protein
LLALLIVFRSLQKTLNPYQNFDITSHDDEGPKRETTHKTKGDYVRNNRTARFM